MIEAPVPANEAQRLKSLHDLGILDTPIEERYERLTRLTCRLLGVPMAAFTLIDENRQWFKSIQGLDSLQSARKLSFCAHAVGHNDMVLVNDAREDNRFSDHPLVTGNPNITFYAGCPVKAPDGHTIGTLCAIDNRPRQIDADELQILKDIAALVENEMKLDDMNRTQTRLVKELDTAQRLALIDPMTRLWNRNGMEEIMRREWAEAQRRQSPLAFVVADIDFFKKVNDTHGHMVGDEVIKGTARKLLSALRAEDAVGRMGGEEFLLVLPNCLEDQLQSTVERLRSTMLQAPIDTAVGPLSITISYGASIAVPQPSLKIEDMIKKADDALYVAKNNGRDRVEIAA